MSDSTITQAFIDKFSSDLQMEYQQNGSRLRPYVQIDNLAAEFGYFEYINKVSAYEKTGRAQEVTPVNTEHVRRRCSMKDYLVPDYIDKFDQKRAQVDFVTGYVRNQSAALGRELDKRIHSAAIGTAYQGRSGATAVTLPASQTIAVDYQYGGGGSASNITTDKIRQALQLLESEGAVGMDMDDVPTVAYTPLQKQALLDIAETLKVDSLTTQAIGRGDDSVTFHGMRFVLVLPEVLAADSNDYRQVIVFAKSAIAVCENANIEVEINYVPDRTSWLVNAMGSFDAARVRDTGVVKVLCSES